MAKVEKKKKLRKSEKQRSKFSIFFTQFGDLKCVLQKKAIFADFKDIFDH